MSDEQQDEAKLPEGFRLRPSRNQKLRSKLKQAGDEPPAAPPQPAPAPPEQAPAAPSPEPAPAAPLKNRRLRRSGHMHDKLTGPLPEDGEPVKRDFEY